MADSRRIHPIRKAGAAQTVPAKSGGQEALIAAGNQRRRAVAASAAFQPHTLHCSWSTCTQNSRPALMAPCGRGCLAPRLCTKTIELESFPG